MLAGQITDFSIEDVFGLLALTRKSGALRVDVVSAGSAGEARVHFRDGAVCMAALDAGRLSIAARLVVDGHLTTDDLRAAAAAADGPGPMAFVTQLLASGVVEPDVLDEYVAEETHDAVAALVRLEQGSFTFDTHVAGPQWERPTHAVADLLSEGRRRAQQWQEIAESLPDLDAVPSVRPVLVDGRDEVTLTRAQWQALSMVDGRRTARTVTELLGTGELAACRVLSELVEAGLVEMCVPGGRSALQEVVAARSALAVLERRGADAGAGAPIPGSDAAAGEASPHPNGADALDAGPTPSDARHADGVQSVHGEVEGGVGAGVPPAPGATDDGSPDDGAADHGTADHGATEEDADEDDDTPQAPPAPSNVAVDRAQMARELASLGLGPDLGPRGGGLRAAAQPTQAPTDVQARVDAAAADAAHDAPPHDAAAAPEHRATMVEHRLARDTGLNRGMLLRLIDGVKGA